MNFKRSFVAFLIGCLTLATAAVIESDISLLRIMSRSNDLMQKNPTRSVECFNYYVPLINDLAEEYQRNYKICLDNGIAGRTKAEEATLEQRNALAQKSNDSCAVLSSCKEQKSAADIFECYVKAGSDNSKTMYAISSDASAQLADLKEQLRLVEVQETKCSTDEKRKYEQESDKAYIEMNKCLAGITPVPTTTKAPSV